MKPTSSVALAVGVGYLVGRKHRLRTALLLGGAVATGRLTKRAGRQSGGSDDGQSDDDGPGMMSKLGGAGKAAARAALTRPVERLGTRIHDTADALRRSGVPVPVPPAPHHAQAQAQADGGEA